MDFNYKCMEFVADCLQVDWNFEKTDEFILEPTNLKNFRNLVNAKSKKDFQNTAYTQVFESKQGFLPDLCILDLIFNEGNAALSYLESQKI